MNRPLPRPGRCGRRYLRHFILPLLVALSPAPPAHAHGTLQVGDLYAGMLHPLLHLEVLLPVLALALWSGQLRAPDAWRVPLSTLAGGAVGAGLGVAAVAFPPATPVLVAAMPIVGGLAAARARLPLPVAVALAAAVGVCAGHAAAYDPRSAIARPALFATGVSAAFGLILYHVGTRVHRHRAFWVQVGARVLGSWIAATGLMVAVLRWAPRR